MDNPPETKIITMDNPPETKIITLDNPPETKIMTLDFYIGSSETIRYTPLVNNGWRYSPAVI